MKLLKEFAVYCEDTDGSERKWGQFFAKSAGHAREIARGEGCKKVLSAEEVAGQKTSEQLRQEIVNAG